MSSLFDQSSKKDLIIKNYLKGVGFPYKDYPNIGIALHHFLRSENNGRVINWVEECSFTTVEEVFLDSIFIGAPKHYANVEARTLTPPSSKVKSIAGILVIRKGLLKIVDGYHRLKHLKEEKVEKATYIILSKEVFPESALTLKPLILSQHSELWKNSLFIEE